MSQISFKNLDKEGIIKKSQKTAEKYSNYKFFRIGSEIDFMKSYMLTNAYTNYFSQYENYMYNRDKCCKKKEYECCKNNKCNEW